MTIWQFVLFCAGYVALLIGACWGGARLSVWLARRERREERAERYARLDAALKFSREMQAKWEREEPERRRRWAAEVERIVKAAKREAP